MMQLSTKFSPDVLHGLSKVHKLKMVKVPLNIPKCTTLRRGFARAKDPDHGVLVMSRVAKNEELDKMEHPLNEEAHLGLHPKLSIT